MNDRVALVTGSTRGIGLAIARQLLQGGFNVVFNGVSNPSLPKEIVSSLETHPGGSDVRYWYIQADVSSVAGRKKIMNMIHVAGRIDILVNNSGIAPKERREILDLEVDDYRRLMRVNLEGPFFLSQGIARIMLDQLEHEHPQSYTPRIVNISSISAYTASTNRGEYCISKAGISMMTKLFAARLAGSIPVFEIRPGIIKTDMTRAVLEKYEALVEEGLLPIKRLGEPRDVAEAVLAIAKNHFPYSTGEVINVDGGFHLRRL
ncbi:3-ketoacyl-ACP reductase [Candidatus Bathyarchaeota archaeon]|nr:3-ketoacyl-ACP reductase [Candidatus Bathyarchaeota archaeon]